MLTAKVKFIEVGREKMSWEELLPLDEDGSLKTADLVRAIRAKGVLMSPNIFFEDDGTISAGIRTVGRFEVELAKPEVKQPA